jgi:uncharacterized protein DUF4038/uncharacterized protein DUF5060
MRLRMIVIALYLCSPAVAAGLDVPGWQPHDFEFASKESRGNPFEVSFSAQVRGPHGTKLFVPGFYDGNGTWKVRISPTAEGEWSLTTRSTLSELNDQERTFMCVANPSKDIHGGLRVDPQYPHQFILEDGTHFFPMGYECDWLWALDMSDPDLKTIDPFLDKIGSYGFNFIILNAYAYDTTWRKGKTGDDDYGPPALLPWEGSNERPDYSKFNLAYWRHYDRVVDAMYRRGIVAHILMRVYNKMVKWPANGGPEDDLYFRWLIARYSAYPNVTWDLAKEANNEKDLNYKIGRLRFIRANDPYRRPLTVHDDHATYDQGAYNGLLDYRSDQQHDNWRATMLDHLQSNAWPVINTEFGYEYGAKGPRDKTYSRAQSAEEVCRRAWEVYMAGGFGVYYYTYTAWDIIRPDDTPPGYAYFKHLREFFDATAYWRMKPTEGIISDGYCLADADREWVVFLNAAKPFTLRLQGHIGPLKAEWFDPLTGQRQDAGAIASGMTGMTPPAPWGNSPVALHLSTIGQ